MRKINGQPVEAITDISGVTNGTSGGEALKWDASTGKMVWELQDGSAYTPPLWYGGRGIFGGGEGSSNVIQYITISSAGNATDFGNLLAGAGQVAGCSNGSRGVFGGGGSSTNVIQYITIAATGNATDFGDLTLGRYGAGGTSNGSRGVFLGGYNGSSWDAGTMDYNR